MTLGAVWTSCAGPVLGSILTVVATSNQLGWSAMLLAYAIGSGVPMLGIAYSGRYVITRVRSFARHAHRLQQGFGIVVDGRPQPPVTVQDSRLYTLFDSGDYGSHVMTLSIPKQGSRHSPSPSDRRAQASVIPQLRLLR